MPRTFNSFSEVKTYLLSVKEDSPCRNRAVDLAEWIFGLGGDGIKPSVKAYLIDDDSDIRFYIRSQGKGHFCIYKLNHKCIWLEVYYGTRVRPGFKYYVDPDEASDKWGFIKRENFENLPIAVIQNDIRQAYELRNRE